MRCLRDVARISSAKGADLQAICATKDRLRLAQSILRQPFDEIGIFCRFSRHPKVDSGAHEKPDSGALSGSSEAWILRGCGGLFRGAAGPRTGRAIAYGFQNCPGLRRLSRKRRAIAYGLVERSERPPRPSRRPLRGLLRMRLNGHGRPLEPFRSDGIGTGL